MGLYFIIFLALFSTLLLIISFIADFINFRLSYGKTDDNEKIKAIYKIVLSLIMSFTWSYILYIVLI